MANCHLFYCGLLGFCYLSWDRGLGSNFRIHFISFQKKKEVAVLGIEVLFLIHLMPTNLCINHPCISELLNTKEVVDILISNLDIK